MQIDDSRKSEGRMIFFCLVGEIGGRREQLTKTKEIHVRFGMQDSGWGRGGVRFAYCALSAYCNVSV